MRQLDEQSAANRRRSFCLTEMSNRALVAGAFGLSAVLWLAILAVL